jgi:apolipoprotein N-acyltransferase
VPLLIALSGWRGRPGILPGQPPLRAFALGVITGVVYFVGTVYWTGAVLSTFGGLPEILAAVAMLLLALYLAVYPAIFAIIVARLISRAGASALLIAPFVWVATEFARGRVFGGFPWVPLGNSQVTVLPVAQLASVLGVYGVSLLVALVNAAIAFALLEPGRRRVRVLAGTAVLLVAVAGWGTWRIADGSLTREGTPLRVGLIQGNIAQEDKWNPRQARRIFTTYVAMTRDAVRRGADYVLWPESSTPFTFGEEPASDQAVRDLAIEVRVPILIGSDEIVHTTPPASYNSAFQIGPDGRTAAVYRKMHLVPFGEFIPLQSWISFVAPLVKRFIPFSEGESVVMLPVGSHRVSTSICYEVVFPQLVRDAVNNGSELLTTITNDGWYGNSSAPFQHFELASMRAIEQGRYLARAANTGISGVIDPYGRVVARSGIFEQVGMVEEVRFLTTRTIYAQVGDVAPYASIVLTLAALIAFRRRRAATSRQVVP